jgi:hypothetical protein
VLGSSPPVANQTSPAALSPPLSRAPLGYALTITLARWPEVVCTATAVFVLNTVSPLVGAVLTCASSWALASAAVVVCVTPTYPGTRGRPFPEETITTAKITKPTTISAAPSKTTLSDLLACANRPRRKALAFPLTKQKVYDN